MTQGTQELTVPLYVDGIPLGRAQGMGLDLIDPERIEFLRGPQGQLLPVGLDKQRAVPSRAVQGQEDAHGQ